MNKKKSFHKVVINLIPFNNLYFSVVVLCSILYRATVNAFLTPQGKSLISSVLGSLTDKPGKGILSA